MISSLLQKMNDLRHMIHRQLFELTAHTGTPAWEWDRASADLHRNHLLPVLEACFDEADKKGEHLIIDRLEIDLGVFSGKDAFAKEAGERLREKLLIILHGKRNEAAAHIIPAAAGSPSRLTNGVTETNTTDSFGEEGASFPVKKPRRETPAALMNEMQARLTAFLHFLKEGRLPWWFDHGGTDFFGKAFQDGLTEKEVRKILYAVERGAGQFENSRQINSNVQAIRCVQVLDDAVMLRMMEEKGLAMPELLREWELLKAAVQRFGHFYPAFRQRYWTLRLQTSSIENWDETHWGVIFPTVTPVHLLAVMLGELSSVKDASLAQFLATRLKEQQNGNEKTDASANPGTQPKSETAIAESKTIRKQEAKHTANKKKEMEEEDGLYLEAAGLVLLHPFLTELFSATGCRANNEWTEQGRQKAVRLLGYLSDGDENLPEYRLVFQKILAGLVPEEPLEAIAPLSDEALASCDELLEAVLKHWSALKSTGKDGLREGFLQRPGILRTGTNGMQLEMEKRAQDVLIARLPWGYSMVRLPWMEQLIAVNWV
ncbi:contractile injection system tape measure protein [Chitinophaga deserti]|uniref:contractile injection system tape measure protein n=1 Tax=Chitinophaga deserti TaxID=2164099 RepID=UPI0013006DA8|nr:contractile injection system tape measure protein [Chitinophaga deserti]